MGHASLSTSSKLTVRNRLRSNNVADLYGFRILRLLLTYLHTYLLTLYMSLSMNMERFFSFDATFEITGPPAAYPGIHFGRINFKV